MSCGSVDPVREQKEKERWRYVGAGKEKVRTNGGVAKDRFSKRR